MSACRPDWPGPLPTSIRSAAGRRQVEQLAGDQAVVDDHRRPRPAAPARAGSAGPGRPGRRRPGRRSRLRAATAPRSPPPASSSRYRATARPSAGPSVLDRPRGGARRGRRHRPASRSSTRPSAGSPSASPATAWAPTGSVHPPPSSARNARSASTTRRTAGVVDGRQRRQRGGVVGPALDRQGALGHLGHHRVPARASRSPRPVRGDPLQPVECGHGPPPRPSPPSAPARARRVARLPRRSAKVRSGRRLASCTRRRAEPVATVAPVGRSSRRAPTSTSRGSPRSGNAASTRPGAGQLLGGGQVLGRVHGGVGVARGPPPPGPP